jgi:hypothetical protein
MTGCVLRMLKEVGMDLTAGARAGAHCERRVGTLKRDELKRVVSNMLEREFFRAGFSTGLKGVEWP